MNQIDFSSYRVDDFDKKLNIMGIRPLDIMITGVTGAGKSTTLNSFFQKNVATVGNGVDPETMNLDSYSLHNFLRLWDTPGLGDGVEKDKEHKKKMVDLLYKTYTVKGSTYGYIDMCIVVVEGANRDMGTTYTLLNEVLVPNINPSRILVIINQADVAMKGRHWDSIQNIPDATLLSYLKEQALSIKKRVKEASGVDIPLPVFYSAEYNWNVKAVFDMILDNIPKSKRTLPTY